MRRLAPATLVIASIAIAAQVAHTQSPTDVAGTWAIDPGAGDAPLMGRHVDAAAKSGILEPKLTIRRALTTITVEEQAGRFVKSRDFELTPAITVSGAASVPKATLVGSTLTTQRRQMVRGIDPIGGRINYAA